MRLAFVHHLTQGPSFRLFWDYTARLSLHHEIDVYTFSTTDPPRLGHRVRQLTRPVTISSLHPLWGLPGLWAYERASRDLARCIDRRGYDACVVFPGSVIRAPSVVKYLKTRHLLYLLDPPHDLAKLNRSNLLACQAGACASQVCQEKIQQLCGRDFPVCRPGINLARFSPGAAPSRSDQPYVLALGSRCHPQALDLAVRSVARVPAAQRPRLVLSWDKPQDQKIADWVRTPRQERRHRELAHPRPRHGKDPIRRRAVDLARHLGVALSCEEDLSDEILVALYRGAEATLWPGCSESLTLLESMACGTPVLALRENEEFLAGELGGFLLPNKEEAFAEKISLLLRDLKLRDDLARKGRQWVQDRWDGESACERLMAQLIGAGETSTPQGTGRPKIRA